MVDDLGVRIRTERMCTAPGMGVRAHPGRRFMRARTGPACATELTAFAHPGWTPVRIRADGLCAPALVPRGRAKTTPREDAWAWGACASSIWFYMLRAVGSQNVFNNAIVLTFWVVNYAASHRIECN